MEDRGVRGMKRLLWVLPVLALGFPATTGASNPPTSPRVTVPSTPGQTIVRTWTGTIPPTTTGTGSSDCTDPQRLPTEVDHHTVRIDAPDYSKVDADYKFTITWTPNTGDPTTADEVLTVVNRDVQDTEGNPDEQDEGSTNPEVGSSDSSDTTEQVNGQNLPSATYDALACGFVNPAPQDYSARLEITTKATEPDVPAANPAGLKFSASVPADPQRDAGEPLMDIDNAGNTYTCGPSGFSNAAEYAQVSTDGGDQFHLLGEPPRGQIGLGGGGDCSIATAPDRNGSGAFNLAYTGLGPLTNFT